MKKIYSLLLVLTLCLTFCSVEAQIKLPKLIADGMVLQRDTPIKIWGWATPQEAIVINFANKSYKTVADNDGNWQIKIKPTQAGGPYKMRVKGENEIIVNDIMIGDVWLCSGQSNMEIPMSRVSPLYGEEIATADNPDIRYFEVPKTYNFNQPQKDIEGGKWEKVNAENIEHFSAVAYFFAKNLSADLKVPIGLINSSLGGSPAEAWLSEEALKKFPDHYAEAQKYKDSSFIKSIEQGDQDRIHGWYNELNKKDIGLAEDWKSINLDSSDWGEMNIPGYWADTDLGKINGSVWFTKKINIPQKWANHPVKLLMGRIVDADSVFVNGNFVGNTTYQYPPRRYEIPAQTLKTGENIITVRVINESGRGGFVEDKPYKLIYNNEEITLEGSWKYKLGVEMPYLKGQTFIRWKPEGLYNAMINPLINYAIKGVIWYQGESNADAPDEYQDLFSTLIKDWRNKWGQGDFPFLYVQLANYMAAKEEPGDSNWARLRDAQLKTLSMPNTGMAVATDIGEWNDIHPLNKKAVGDRLAQAAKNVAYGEDIVPGGPVFKSVKNKDDKMIISFKNVGSGLIVKGDKLEYFSIAGEDKKFVWAKAKIEGDKIIVSSPEVKNPVAVRYGWADNPEGANLYNKEGFPASAFRTDSW
ncbi:MAG: sialate O-acetylesterase [Leeuwenhoekiella sp.]